MNTKIQKKILKKLKSLNDDNECHYGDERSSSRGSSIKNKSRGKENMNKNKTKMNKAKRKCE